MMLTFRRCKCLYSTALHIDTMYTCGTIVSVSSSASTLYVCMQKFARGHPNHFIQNHVSVSSVAVITALLWPIRHPSPCCCTSADADDQLLYWCGKAELSCGDNHLDDQALDAAEMRTRAWVSRTLSPDGGLKFCPYTRSADSSATGLEDLGVSPAPILYSVCASADIESLMAEFWIACTEMMASGEEGCSSILLSAPQWDNRFTAWCEDVFPALEASVEEASLDRSLGVVCFHPHYSTPDGSWLKEHRFGHLHPTSRLREYLEEHDPELAAATSDDELTWAGSYQRRSPHATINVLWASQLEIAETRRRSSSLYTRNLRLALSTGREELQRVAEAERR